MRTSLKQTVLLLLACGFMRLVQTGQAQPQNAQDEAVLPRPRTDVPSRFNRLTVDDGLSNSVVQAILQDRHGFMWHQGRDPSA